MGRTVRVLVAATAVVVAGAWAAGSAQATIAGAPVPTSERCVQLQHLAEDALRALTAQALVDGRKPAVAARRARSIAAGELTPTRLKRPLRSLAKVFDLAASGASIVDLVPSAGTVAFAILDIQQYVAEGCPARHGERPPLRERRARA